jgi:soluble lytic murein transglycosylase-like protein
MSTGMGWSISPTPRRLPKTIIASTLKKKKVYSSQVYSPQSFENYIRQASNLYGIAFPLLKAIIKAESDFNPRAVSKKGAMGLYADHA